MHLANDGSGEWLDLNFAHARPTLGPLCLSDHGLARLVEAYRAHGHKLAKINPLLPQMPVQDSVPEISALAGTLGGPFDTSGGPLLHCGRVRAPCCASLHAL